MRVNLKAGLLSNSTRYRCFTIIVFPSNNTNVRDKGLRVDNYGLWLWQAIRSTQGLGSWLPVLGHTSQQRPCTCLLNRAASKETLSSAKPAAPAYPKPSIAASFNRRCRYCRIYTGKGLGSHVKVPGLFSYPVLIILLAFWSPHLLLKILDSTWSRLVDGSHGSI